MRRLIGSISLGLVSLVVMQPVKAGHDHGDSHHGDYACETAENADFPGGCGECRNSYAFSLWADYCNTKPQKHLKQRASCRDADRGCAVTSCGDCTALPYGRGLGAGAVQVPYPDPVVPAVPKKAENNGGPHLGPPTKLDSAVPPADAKPELQSAINSPKGTKPERSTNETSGFQQPEPQPEQNPLLDLPRSNTPDDQPSSPDASPATDSSTKSADENRSAWFPKPRLKSFKPRFDR